MPSFPRSILPASATPFLGPAGLQSFGTSGKAQIRSLAQAGRRWTETYPAFYASSDAGRELLAWLNYARNGMVAFDVVHQLHLTHKGSGGGTVRVKGASQTGTSLVTDGWTGGNPVIKAGSLIKVAGVPFVQDVVVDSPNLSGTTTTLTISPGIFQGGAPADNAIITYTGVTVLAFISEPPDLPAVGPDDIVQGLRVTFAEKVA